MHGDGMVAAFTRHLMLRPALSPASLRGLEAEFAPHARPRCWDELAGGQQLFHVDSRFDAQPLQQVDDILGRDVPRSAGGIWAAAEAGDRAVEDARMPSSSEA